MIKNWENTRTTWKMQKTRRTTSRNFAWPALCNSSPALPLSLWRCRKKINKILQKTVKTKVWRWMGFWCPLGNLYNLALPFLGIQSVIPRELFVFHTDWVSKVVSFWGHCMANWNDAHNKVKDPHHSLSEEDKESPGRLGILGFLWVWNGFSY